MNPQVTYEQHLGTIERIAAFVARRNHLDADKTDDFKQEVQLRLMENDYAIIRKFEGRSLFSTYLTTVIGRLFQQCRVEMWGKWRPSAEAKRLGPKAITLERLLTRDGLTFDEAVKELTTPAGAQYTVAELELIYLRLPARNPRPMFVSDEMTPEIAAADSDAGERVEMSDRERAARNVVNAFDRLAETMEPEDRLILYLRFRQSLKVPDIADRLHIEQKKLYKRLDKLYGTMRRALEEEGFEKSDIGTLLSSGDQEIRFEFLHATGEIRPFRPSNPPGGDEGARGSEGGMR